MRFNSLKLNFGHFSDFNIEFDQSKNMHLLYGSNEAGKSTILRSISDLLYGFPNRTNDGFHHGNNKLRIEGHLQNTNGDELSFIRRKGSKNTVLDLNGNTLNEKNVQKFIQGLPKSQFESMFALNHETLREGGENLLHSGGSAGEGLFSAASGINILREIINKLNKETGDIFLKGGSRPQLNKLIKQEKELNVAENQLRIQTWKELERKYQNGKKEIEQLLDLIKGMRQKQRKLERITQMLPRISQRQDLIEKLDRLGVIPDLPEDVKERRTNAEIKLETTLKEKGKLEEQIEDIKEQLQLISIPEKVLEQAAIIDALYQEVITYQTNVNIIPELEGKQNQLKEQVLSIMKEIGGIHANLDNVDSFRLTAEKKETIRELIQKKPLIDKDLDYLMEELKKSNRDLERKTDELDQLPNLPSIDELETAIDQAKRAGAIEEMIDKTIKESSEKKYEINEAISALPLWEGTYEEFQVFTVSVLVETINKFEKEHDDLSQKFDKVSDEIKQQQKLIEQYEENIRKIDSRAEIPSAEKLFDVRSIRDSGWKIIRKKLESGEWDEHLNSYTNGEKIEVVYENKVQEADQVADTMRLAAEQVGEKNKLLADIEIGKQKIEDLENLEAILRNDLCLWKDQWESLWQPTEIKPLSPKEMKEWLDKYTKIKTIINENELSKAALNEMISKKEHLKADLTKALQAFEKASNVKSLNELLNLAEKQLKETRELLSRKNNIESAIYELKEKIRGYKNKIDDQKAVIENWEIKWYQAIQNTTITVETSPSVAGMIIQQYEKCIQSYDSYLDVKQQKKAIQEQKNLYEASVKDLVRAVNIDFGNQNVEIIVNKLNVDLLQARKDQVQWDNLNNQLDQLQEGLAEVIRELNEAQGSLDDLLQQAKVPDISELKLVEQKFLQKKEYTRSLQIIEEEMLKQGNGKSIKELLDEASSYDIDTIQGELEVLEQELESTENKRSITEQAYGVVKNEYEEKIQGHTSISVQVEQEKNSIQAQITELTEQYVQLKLASILLQKGIEEYRNQNQNPIVTRAGEIFSKITLGYFIDVIVDYDEKDQPILMGVRANGEKVDIESMSDGTKDQLYLSLRIASIDKYIQENESIPFIVDDILVHFDDHRSKETLKVLLELSHRTQIIFFTHHTRLVELMEEISKEDTYQVMEIDKQNSMVKY